MKACIKIFKMLLLYDFREHLNKSINISLEQSGWSEIYGGITQKHDFAIHNAHR